MAKNVSLFVICGFGALNSNQSIVEKLDSTFKVAE
jgi:hypothetical protein